MRKVWRKVRKFRRIFNSFSVLPYESCSSSSSPSSSSSSSSFLLGKFKFYFLKCLCVTCLMFQLLAGQCGGGRNGNTVKVQENLQPENNEVRGAPRVLGGGRLGWGLQVRSAIGLGHGWGLRVRGGGVGGEGDLPDGQPKPGGELVNLWIHLRATRKGEL